MTIKLGVIGSSEGNGHPYSWSSIFNGYDFEKMQECEYPVISEYLSEQSWPDSKISGATVSSIWTQEFELSKRIAGACNIDHVASTLDELQNRVDAILLARDDSENHLYFAQQFLLAGKPIYIDKPIALSLTALHELYKLEQYPGQIFTCSALRYGSEFFLSNEDKEALGKRLIISASIPKSWEKYAVHIIEPVLNMILPNDKLLGTEVIFDSATSRTLIANWESGIRTSFTTLGNVKSAVEIKIVGKNGSKNLFFKDTFAAFRSALQDYIDGIFYKQCRSPFEFNAKVVDLIERGMV